MKHIIWLCVAHLNVRLSLYLEAHHAAWANKHPLDAVESALVDASNALDEVRSAAENSAQYDDADGFIDAALREVQRIIRYDLDPGCPPWPADPRD
jgi:hypothetical protein